MNFLIRLTSYIAHPYKEVLFSNIPKILFFNNFTNKTQMYFTLVLQ